MNILNSIRDYRAKQRDNRFISYLKQNQEQIVKDPKRFMFYADFELTEEQQQAIDDFYVANYGEKIDSTCHKTYTAYSGVFDEKYVPEQIYIPEIEHFFNINEDYCKVLEDKNVMPYISKSIGVKTPVDIARCIQGMIVDIENKVIIYDMLPSLIRQYGKVFVKPTVESGGGEGCFVIDTYTKDYTDEYIIETIRGLGNDWVIQQCVICSESIRKVYEHGVCTFRIMTYRWRNDILFCPIIMRIGVGGMELDNVSAGGIFIGVDDCGTLFDYAIGKYGEKYHSHPDTKLPFKAYRIANFEKIITSAIRMHTAIPQIGIVNWDFTIDDSEEPVLIEGNIHYGGCWVFQMTGRNLFGDNTENVLRWVRKMKRYSIAEQKQHKFGF